MSIKGMVVADKSVLRVVPEVSFVNTKWLKCRQISVQFYISLWQLRAGLGLGKSTVFCMALPAL